MLKIYLPEQVELRDEDYYELIIYRIDIEPFICKTYDINENTTTINIPNELETNSFKSILQTSNDGIALIPSNIDNQTIVYNMPANYNISINNISVYTNTNIVSMHINRDEQQDNVVWSELDGHQVVTITHNLNGIVNCILRKNEVPYTEFIYNDYILSDLNKIMIVLPDTPNAITDFLIDIFIIFN